MGFTLKEIDRFQLKRIAITLLCFLLGLGFASFVHPAFLLLFVIVGGAYWLEKYRNVQRSYKKFHFVQQVSFSKFCRMLIPYLLAGGNGKSLYGMFDKIARRLDGHPLQEPLYQLMAEMTDQPKAIAPYIRFAEVCSNTDEALNFMTTLYYYQQSSDDPTIIQELGRIANDELFKGVHEIIDYKVRKMSKLPMFLVFALGVPLLGILGAMIYSTIVTSLLL
ncbi:hypothetical protein [Enterococcus rivorum]